MDWQSTAREISVQTRYTYETIYYILRKTESIEKTWIIIDLESVAPELDINF